VAVSRHRRRRGRARSTPRCGAVSGGSPSST